MKKMTTMLIVDRPRAKLINQPFHVTKRLMDIGICLLLLPLILPIVIIVAILIVIDSKGPILFKQRRIGKGGRPFEMYKFRTMEHNFDKSSHQEFMKNYIKGQISTNGANADVASFKPPIQNHITKVGKFLRKTSIDELPQIINVLRGEMSLVGPRPNVPWEVEAYDSWHNERLEVKPGITGLAQVKGRSGISFDELVRYDVSYVRNQGLDLELKICWWTLAAVLKGHGAS